MNTLVYLLIALGGLLLLGLLIAAGVGVGVLIGFVSKRK